MDRLARIIVEEGPEKGREIEVPPDGSRFGRSSKNDIVIKDEQVSRHHCRFYFKSDGNLAIADLGSANKTLLNDNTVHESPLTIGDRVTIGETVLKVIDDGMVVSKIDLGLKTYEPVTRPAQFNKGWLVGLLLLAVLIALAAWIPKLVRKPPPPEIVQQVIEPDADILPMEIRYEKVLADDTRIFRYLFRITPENRLVIEIDDTDRTHIREEGVVRDVLIEELAEFIDASGFSRLSSDYKGLQPNVLDHWDITITLGKQTKRVLVVNRNEPEVFNRIRTKLEHFGQVELGLWAVQFPAEELIERAERAYLQGRKLYSERTVEYGNLAHSIKSFNEADFFLRTIDPKPEYYGAILTGITQSREALNKAYIDRNYSAERAIRLKDWEEADAQLQILCRMFPDRTDKRYEESRHKLIEVQRRIQTEKR